MLVLLRRFGQCYPLLTVKTMFIHVCGLVLGTAKAKWRCVAPLLDAGCHPNDIFFGACYGRAVRHTGAVAPPKDVYNGASQER